MASGLCLLNAWHTDTYSALSSYAHLVVTHCCKILSGMNYGRNEWWLLMMVTKHKIGENHTVPTGLILSRCRCCWFIFLDITLLMLLLDFRCFSFKQYAIMKCCKGSTTGTVKITLKFVVLTTQMKVSNVIGYPQHDVRCIHHPLNWCWRRWNRRGILGGMIYQGAFPVKCGERWISTTSRHPWFEHHLKSCRSLKVNSAL